MFKRAAKKLLSFPFSLENKIYHFTSDLTSIRFSPLLTLSEDIGSIVPLIPGSVYIIGDEKLFLSSIVKRVKRESGLSLMIWYKICIKIWQTEKLTYI